MKKMNNALALMMSLIPHTEGWNAPYNRFSNGSLIKKGSTDRYAGIHPKARNKAQECERRRNRSW